MIQTLADLIRARAADLGPRAALTFEGRDISWVELDERASRVARGLVEAGVGPQEHVAFLDKNSPEYFEVPSGGPRPTRSTWP